MKRISWIVLCVLMPLVSMAKQPLPDCIPSPNPDAPPCHIEDAPVAFPDTTTPEKKNKSLAERLLSTDETKKPAVKTPPPRLPKPVRMKPVRQAKRIH